jgi:predicted nucleotide-binding protein
MLVQHDLTTAMHLRLDEAKRHLATQLSEADCVLMCGLIPEPADDPLEGQLTRTAIPRDNVLLEAGYFMSAHTAKRLVVVREKGTKMPADLGGMIYLTIERRADWSKTATDVLDALRRQMSGEI